MDGNGTNEAIFSHSAAMAASADGRGRGGARRSLVTTRTNSPAAGRASGSADTFGVGVARLP